jgi:hypothetical protein
MTGARVHRREGAITALDAKRLAKLCGMFGSEHIGERAAAAAAADRLVREQGLSWVDVIRGPWSRSSRKLKTINDKLDFLSEHADVLTDWEKKFIVTVRGFRRKSRRQIETINGLVDKVCDLARASV